MTKIKMILSSLAVAFFTSNAFALGSEELLVRALNAKAVSAHVVPSAASLINVYYSGGADNEINISSGLLNLEAPVGTVVGNFNFALPAYDTVGELCDAINAVDAFECKMTGGKRNDASTLTWIVAAQAVNTSGGYDVLIGTGVVEAAAETIRYTNRLGITPADGKRVSLKYCTIEGDGAGTMLVYGKLAKYETATDGVTRNDTTLAASFPIADDTAETNGNVYGGAGWDFAKDAHVVIAVGNVTTSQVDTTSHIYCSWEEK